MEITPYTLQDSPGVSALFREIFKESGWEERPSDYMDQPHLLFHLPDKGILLVVKEENHVIGTAGVILLSNSEGLIKRFYISTENRGTGIAQQLLEALLLKSKEMGITKLVLDVSKNNTRAIRFYEKSGFLPTTVVPQEDWPESSAPETHLYFYKMLQ